MTYPRSDATDATPVTQFADLLNAIARPVVESGSGVGGPIQSVDSNWTIGAWEAVWVGSVLYLTLVATRTGSAITTGSDGNFGDQPVFTLAPAYRSVTTLPIVHAMRVGVAELFGFITSGGDVKVTHSGVPSTTVVASGADVRLWMTYPAVGA